MLSPSRDVAQLIEDAALGFGVFGTDLFVSKQPDSPNECITIFDTGGEDPEARYVYDRPFVQILVRGLSYDAAYLQLTTIRGAVNGQNNITLNGTRYIQILQQSDIIFTGYDDQDRAELTLNFAIHRTA